MNKRRTWKCDFEGCKEIAEWYRIVKGTPVKLCTHHETHMRKQHMGKPIDYSQLDGDNMLYLEEKDEQESERIRNNSTTNRS